MSRTRPASCTRSSSSPCARSCPRASTSTSTSPPATARGSSASPSSPTATCSRRCARGRPRSSPTRSRRSPSTGSRSAPARRSRPTSWSAPPGSTSPLSATSRSAVDGAPVDFPERVTWRGVMISGIPNMAYTFGYFRHSWTLRADLVSGLVSRLLATWRPRAPRWSFRRCAPRSGDADPAVGGGGELNAGYVMRSRDLLFKQGDREPWTHMAEHPEERDTLPGGGPGRRDARLPLKADAHGS